MAEHRREDTLRTFARPRQTKSNHPMLRRLPFGGAVLSLLNRLPCASRSMVFRMIGIGVAGSRTVCSAATGRERVLGCTAAAAGGHRPALLQTGIAAAPHPGSHVGTAIVNRPCRGRRGR